jgi:hypothetical protein
MEFNNNYFEIYLNRSEDHLNYLNILSGLILVRRRGISLDAVKPRSLNS